MKSKALKKLIKLAVFVAILGTFSSCNRGYGCPNNFSIGDTITNVVQNVATSAIKAIVK